ncbi:MAG: phosphoribosylglycinamide formyltransferase [Clostridia bacterium]|nr:phosphoribosylglycinamide formyltransferase [Clostridia bacterium]
MLNIAVLVSGGGTNLQAIIDAVKSGKITGGKVTAVVSSNPNAYALERAKTNGIETAVISKKDYETLEAYDTALVNYMKEKNIDLIVLAGFLSIVGETLVKEFPNRIINVHPSLIPSFCGKGFYGLTVHEKALEYGVKVTGATVHFVNEIVDGGQIILQKAVYIEPDDTPEILQKRVMEQAEWEILPKAIDMICNGEI